MDKVIEVINARKTYKMGDNIVHALDGIDFTVRRGEFVAIMGPSGSGKSTLMNLLGCLDRPTSGSYILETEDVAKADDNKLAYIRNKHIGFVFQNFNLLARISALDNVALPLVYSDVRRAERIIRAQQTLTNVGLGDRSHHKPNELSGGQRQRVAIARALINNPAIIMADEPTGNLDTKSGDEIIAMFRKLNDEGRTIILVTHEPEIAAHAKRTILIRDGKIVSDEVNHVT
ncbi:MAG: ABC transporter ATP-binding protein [Negativicutes bacterium]|jgi:putative ABC transport system ATP-binding protein